jgi:hypothetical protein
LLQVIKRRNENEGGKMRAKSYLVLLVPAIVLAASVCSIAAQQRSAPGAFIEGRCDSVRALVSQIRTNKVVGARFARHFGKSAELVAASFENNLVLTTLKTPRRVTTFYVSKTSVTMPKQKILPAGTKVFATKDGQLILEWRCCNPLTKTLPLKINVSQPLVPPTTPETKVEAVTPTEVVLPPVVATAPTIDMVQPAVPVSPFIPEIEPVMEAVATPPVTAMPGLPSVGWLVPALLGAVRVHSSPSENVPEPASALVLGMGVAGLVIRKRKLHS